MSKTPKPTKPLPPKTPPKPRPQPGKPKSKDDLVQELKDACIEEVGKLQNNVPS